MARLTGAKKIGKGLGVPTLTPAQERARRSVSEFRKLLPTLTAYARNLTGRKDVKVEMDAHSNGHTDGKVIYFRPPLALGDMDSMRHDKSVCDKRDPQTLQLLCAACDVREDILATVYHEISHIAFDTFLQVGSDDVKGALEKIEQTAPDWYYRQVFERYKAGQWSGVDSFLKLAAIVNPYFKALVNGLEDVRINERMAQARPGTRIMQAAKTYKVAIEGVEQKDAKGNTHRVKWPEYEPNLQAAIGLFCLGSGYPIDGWFAPRIEAALKDRVITDLSRDVPKLTSAKKVFERSFEIFLRMRELGFFVTKDEELPEPPPMPEPEPQPEPTPEESKSDDSESDGADAGSDDSGNSEGSDSERDESADSDSGGTAGGEDEPSDGSDQDGEQADDGSDPGPDGEDRGDAADPDAGGEADNADSGGEGGPDDTESDDGADRGSDRRESDEGSGSDSVGEDETPAPDGDADEGQGAGSEASGNDDAEDSSTDSGDDAGSSEGAGEDGEPAEAGSSGSDDAESGDGSAPGDSASGDATGESDTGPDAQSHPRNDADAESGSEEAEGDLGPSEGEGEGEPSEGDGSDVPDNSDAEAGTVDGDSSESTDGDDSGTGGENRSGDADGEESAGSEADSDEVQGEGDGGTDPSSGPGPGSEDGEGDAYVEPLDYRPEEARDGTDRESDPIVPPTVDSDTKIELVDLGLHSEVEEPNSNIEQEIENAIVQGLYFTKPSSHIGGLRVWKYDEREADVVSRPWHAWDGTYYDDFYGTQSKPVIDPVGEQYLGPALMKLRVAFEDNKRSHRNRNQRAGKIDGRALGKRAWQTNDDRLFGRKVLPKKKDYFVVIGLDVSGSTRGVNIKMIKEAALAQAELCQRLGVKFAVYAHTGGPLDMERLDARYVDIYEIKGPEQPWDNTTRAALMDIGPSAANLDGHTLEFYRKVAERDQATNKVILYYSDGAMPLENYHEELEILQSEIQTCRQLKITLLGVGVRTDSPKAHGLDTVQIDDSSQVGKVVTHLAGALIP